MNNKDQIINNNNNKTTTIASANDNNNLNKPYYNNHYYLNNNNNENTYPIKQKCYFKLFISDIHKLNVTTSKRFLYHQRIPIKNVELFGHIISFQKKRKFGLWSLELVLDDSTQAIECDYCLFDTPNPIFTNNSLDINSNNYIQSDNSSNNNSNNSNNNNNIFDCPLHIPYSLGSFIRVWGSLKYDSFCQKVLVKVHIIELINDPNKEMYLWLEYIKIQKEYYFSYVQHINSLMLSDISDNNLDNNNSLDNNNNNTINNIKKPPLLKISTHKTTLLSNIKCKLPPIQQINHNKTNNNSLNNNSSNNNSNNGNCNDILNNSNNNILNKNTIRVNSFSMNKSNSNNNSFNNNSNNSSINNLNKKSIKRALEEIKRVDSDLVKKNKQKKD